ncbi:MAG: META domain-containing protein [Bacteroidetes bacterium]|nr:META domain-containing protein [Bacteroidota bacterium]
MRTAFVFSIVVLFGACASTPGSSNNPLAGTDWELRSIVEGSDSLTTLPRDGLHFTSEYEISMRSCNICNGFYTAKGSNLMTSHMICTLRACEQDRPELAHLIGDTSTYRLRGDWLIIETGGIGSKRLYFAPGLPPEGN